jgi:hypothetical protein
MCGGNIGDSGSLNANFRRGAWLGSGGGAVINLGYYTSLSSQTQAGGSYSITGGTWYWMECAFNKAGSNMSNGNINVTMYADSAGAPGSILMTYETDNASMTNDGDPRSNWTFRFLGYGGGSAYVFDTLDVYNASANVSATPDNLTVAFAYPANRTLNLSTTMDLAYTVSSMTAPGHNCSIVVNGTVLATEANVGNATYMSPYTGVGGGNYTWSVNCSNGTNNVNTQQRWFQFDYVPDNVTVSFEYPANRTINLSRTIDLAYTISTMTAPGHNCSIVINNTVFATQTNVGNATYMSQYTGSNGGNYTWGVNCSNGTNDVTTQQRWFGFEYVAPSTNLSQFKPVNGTLNGTMLLSYNVSTNVAPLECTIVVNGTTRDTQTVSNGTATYTWNDADAAGLYDWTVNCSDGNTTQTKWFRIDPVTYGTNQYVKYDDFNSNSLSLDLWEILTYEALDPTSFLDGVVKVAPFGRNAGYACPNIGSGTSSQGIQSTQNLNRTQYTSVRFRYYQQDNTTNTYPYKITVGEFNQTLWGMNCVQPNGVYLSRGDTGPKFRANVENGVTSGSDHLIIGEPIGPIGWFWAEETFNQNGTITVSFYRDNYGVPGTLVGTNTSASNSSEIIDVNLGYNFRILSYVVADTPIYIDKVELFNATPENSMVTLTSPADGATITNLTAQFQFELSNTTKTKTCTLTVNGTAIGDVVAAGEGNYSIGNSTLQDFLTSQNGVAESYTWNVDCAGTTAVSRSFNVRTELDITAITCPAVTYPNENDTPKVANFSLNFSVLDAGAFADFSLDVNVTLGATQIHLDNVTECTYANVDANNRNYNCTVVLRYWYPAGSYNSSIYVKGGSVEASNSSTCDVGALVAFRRTLSALTFPNATPGIADSPSALPMGVLNLGNVPLTIYITAYDLPGQSYPGYVLPASGFKVGTVLGSAVALANNTQVNTTVALSAANASSVSLGFWLTMSSTLYLQNYVSKTPWVLVGS